MAQRNSVLPGSTLFHTYNWSILLFQTVAVNICLFYSDCSKYNFHLLVSLTLILVMLYCIVRMTTRINIPPNVISLICRSLNHVTFFNTLKECTRITNQ